MIVTIPDILAFDATKLVRAKAKSMRFVDGGATAGKFARAVKNNQQLEPGPETEKLQHSILEAVRANLTFEMAARPKIIKPPLVARYEPGMEYGTHVDNALMSGRPPIRSDMSFTLFLEDPDKYDGGELVIEGMLGTQEIKLPPGALVLYPTSALHHVAPVTRGQRLVAVSWVQSLIRDPAQRELLFDLETARRTLFDSHGKTAEFDLVSKSFHNLLRMWAEI
ncbi:MAG: Fe2+-dependent dioxygenase [Pseudomonadota bacterium]